jgi:hypothetical protein
LLLRLATDNTVGDLAEYTIDQLAA